MTTRSEARPVVACVRDRHDFEAVRALPPTSLEVLFISGDDGTLADVPPSVEAIVLASVGPPIPSDVFARFPHLRLVHFTGVGIDRVDAQALRDHEIAVRGCPAVNAADVAEYTVTAAIVLLRRLLSVDGEIKGGNYVSARRAVAQPPLRGLRGLQWGIIGMGTIGLAVARLATSFTCSVVYYDPTDIRAPDGTRPLPLRDLLITSDVVSVHVPLLPETVGLLSGVEIGLLGVETVLINAARGGIVDEDAVRERLEAGSLWGAAFDVYETEPPVPQNGILGLVGTDQVDRVLLTPHIAGVTYQAWSDLFTYTWASVDGILRSEGVPGSHATDI